MKGQDFLGTGSNRIKIYVADSFFTRLRGLIGHELAEDEGLLLISCNQIHSMFMSYPIDVLYLSEERQVIRIARGMRPWSFGQGLKLPVYPGNEERQCGAIWFDGGGQAAV